jgi:chromate reductase, NAD(P)H dehydrogenase (quinone)
MITLISGTNRPSSNTRKVTAFVESLYRELGVPTTVVDLQELPLDLFRPEAYATKPAAFAPFGDAVLKAKGVVIVTPEYNGSFPGVLKLFIDHLKFPEAFESRPVAFVGLAAGMWGALRSVEQLSQIFAYRNAYQLPRRVFIPGVGSALTPEGAPIDPELAARLKSQATEFVSFVNALSAGTAS